MPYGYVKLYHCQFVAPLRLAVSSVPPVLWKWWWWLLWWFWDFICETVTKHVRNMLPASTCNVYFLFLSALITFFDNSYPLLLIMWREVHNQTDSINGRGRSGRPSFAARLWRWQRAGDSKHREAEYDIKFFSWSLLHFSEMHDRIDIWWPERWETLVWHMILIFMLIMVSAKQSWE